MLKTILPSVIWRGPKSSKAGIIKVMRAKDIQLATAKRQSDIISGSSGLHQLRPVHICKPQISWFFNLESEKIIAVFAHLQLFEM